MEIVRITGGKKVQKGTIGNVIRRSTSSYSNSKIFLVEYKLSNQGDLNELLERPGICQVWVQEKHLENI